MSKGLEENDLVHTCTCDKCNYKKALEIIKECLIVNDKGDYIEIACDFSIPKKIKGKYELLKEVLL